MRPRQRGALRSAARGSSASAAGACRSRTRSRPSPSPTASSTGLTELFDARFRVGSPGPGPRLRPASEKPQARHFYYVSMSGISVAAEMLSVPRRRSRWTAAERGIIVDSAHAVTRLQTDVTNSLRDAFVKGTWSLTKAEGLRSSIPATISRRGRASEVRRFRSISGGQGAEGSGEELPDSGTSAGRILLRVRADELAAVDHRNVQQQGTRVALICRTLGVGFTAISAREVGWLRECRRVEREMDEQRGEQVQGDGGSSCEIP
ncbi:uncharacterized protein A4U43_C01F32620 [Asparagus officinalis]|uniref:Uncharacterized protein n=1 Tax=Asparagus officinalis TaxID=4686 RepID=A0A5P1FUJ6_ASPOF|nr:uncharacterized protein A4U43_C01F32620 [Asparagus officinalis]